MSDLKLQWIVLAVMIPVTIYTELKDGKIYNWLTLPAIAMGLFLAVLESNEEFLISLWGMLLGGGVFMIPYVVSGISRGRPVIGGGDVKFAGAVGALMGWAFCIWVIYYGVLVGAVIGISTLVWRKVRAGKPRAGEGETAAEGPALLMRVPFGTALCLGVIIVFGKSYLAN